jgi:hypothetical protein
MLAAGNKYDWNAETNWENKRIICCNSWTAMGCLFFLRNMNPGRQDKPRYLDERSEPCKSYTGDTSSYPKNASLSSGQRCLHLLLIHVFL